MGVEYRYLDILWLDNLIMNFILLWTTSKIYRDNAILWRLCIASCIGALYAVTYMVFKLVIFNWLIIKISISLCMLLVAFKFRTIREYFRLVGAFYVVTFAFGGAAFGLYYFSRDILTIDNGVFYIHNFPAKTLTFASLLLIIFTNTIWIKIRRKWQASSLIYKIEIGFNGMNIVLDALLDTGNSLYDPITHNPVIIVEYSKIKEALPQEIRDIFIHNNDKDLDYITDTISESSLAIKFRIIPFYAIDKPGGMLIGFKCDGVLIYIDDKCYKNENVIIAIYNDRLSKEQEYHALIHPEVVRI